MMNSNRLVKAVDHVFVTHNGLRHKVIDNFLTPVEIEHLLSLVKTNANAMHKSSGWDVEKGQSTVTDYRTSENLFLQAQQTPVVEEIEKRIATLTNTPLQNGEPMQILRYKKGQYYKVHHDYFDPNYSTNEKILRQGGQRVITVLMYLSTLQPGQGGETRFPNAKVTVRPVAGRALIWPNTFEDGTTVDPITLHEAIPVSDDNAVKYVMTKWIRQNKFGFF